MHAFESHLLEHRLTTAEILYHLPDHPAVLQAFVWQQFDTAPGFPLLRKFLDFWQQNIEGRLHSVRIASVPVSKPPSTRVATAYYTLH